jgi:hypothetical protein
VPQKPLNFQAQTWLQYRDTFPICAQAEPTQGGATIARHRTAGRAAMIPAAKGPAAGRLPARARRSKIRPRRIPTGAYRRFSAPHSRLGHIAAHAQIISSVRGRSAGRRSSSRLESALVLSWRRREKINFAGIQAEGQFVLYGPRNALADEHMYTHDDYMGTGKARHCCRADHHEY